MANYEPADLAYAAGIIDGEGYIGITCHEKDKRRARSSPTFLIVVSVGMADLEVPSWLHQTFGGGLYSYPPRDNGRGIHHWRIASANAVEFCRVVRPFLKIKHRQAQLVLEYAVDPKTTCTARGPGSSVPVDTTQTRREYATQLRALNRREKVA